MIEVSEKLKKTSSFIGYYFFCCCQVSKTIHLIHHWIITLCNKDVCIVNHCGKAEERWLFRYVVSSRQNIIYLKHTSECRRGQNLMISNKLFCFFGLLINSFNLHFCVWIQSNFIHFPRMNLKKELFTLNLSSISSFIEPSLVNNKCITKRIHVIWIEYISCFKEIWFIF